MASSPSLGLGRRLAARELVVGTFVKTTAAPVVEILGGRGLDFLVLDAEHAPFDRGSLDTCLLAARAVGVEALVRIPDHRPAEIGAVLDLGAAGVVAPRVSSVAEARRIVEAASYAGGRGLSTSPRAGGYGMVPVSEHVAASDRECVVLCQVEDRQGLDDCAGIAGTAGVAGLFIGPVDLSASLGLSPGDEELSRAVERIRIAANNAGKAAGVFAANAEAARQRLAEGFDFVVVSSDQGLLAASASALVKQLRDSGNG